MPRAVGAVRGLNIVLAKSVIDEGLAQDTVHGQEGIFPRLAHDVLQGAQISAHGKTRTGKKLKCALVVTAPRRGECRAVMQLGAGRVIAHDVEPDIAGADEIAARDRRVDVVYGPFERG